MMSEHSGEFSLQLFELLGTQQGHRPSLSVRAVGVGYFLVAQHLRPTVFVDDRCRHRPYGCDAGPGPVVVAISSAIESAAFHGGACPIPASTVLLFRNALVRAPMEPLEESSEIELSLRAVASPCRRVASGAVRHYADREALISAVAAVGYHELAGRLTQAHPSPSSPQQLVAVATASVQFALERPALLRIMFTEPCDRDNDERVTATAAVSEYVGAIVVQNFPHADVDPFGDRDLGACPRGWLSCTSTASSMPLVRSSLPTGSPPRSRRC